MDAGGVCGVSTPTMTRSPYSNDCVKDGYADPFDAMGHGSGGLCAVQLDQLGWLAVRKIDVPGALGGPPLGQVV
jgi:hypothetical protein